MLALYNNKIFKAVFLDDESDNKSMVCLFTFKETEGFEKKKNIGGGFIYEKNVYVKDIQELYAINFYAEYFGKKLSAGCTPEENKLHLRSGGTVFAYDHDFEEIERGMMIKTVNIDEASKFFIEKYDYKGNEENPKTTYEVTKEEFVKLYQTNIIDLITY